MASRRTRDEIPNDVRTVLLAEADIVAKLADRLDWTIIESLVDLLVEPQGRVFTSGCGTSGAAAKKIAHTLTCIGCPTTFLSPADAPHGAMGVVRPGDVVILITKGGATTEIVRMLPGLQSLGAVIVAITGVDRSPVGDTAAVAIRVDVDSEPDPLDMLASGSTLAVMALMDAVAITVMQRNGFDTGHFGVIHPGGAVGERLLAGEYDKHDTETEES